MNFFNLNMIPKNNGKILAAYKTLPNASESWYAGMGCNPINMVDPVGQWPKVFNCEPENEITKGYSSNLLSSNQFNAKEFEKDLRGKISIDWSNPKSKHYAPKVAEFYEKNVLYIGIYKYKDDDIGGSNIIFNNKKSKYILLNEKV